MCAKHEQKREQHQGMLSLCKLQKLDLAASAACVQPCFLVQLLAGFPNLACAISRSSRSEQNAQVRYNLTNSTASTHHGSVEMDNH
eukprot:6204028-Pleurochrysis_carterae.AAC.1